MMNRVIIQWVQHSKTAKHIKQLKKNLYKLYLHFGGGISFMPNVMFLPP
jgi:uncharacterized membrane protein